MKNLPQLDLSVRLTTALTVVLTSLLLVHGMVRLSSQDVRKDLAQFAAIDARHAAAGLDAQA